MPLATRTLVSVSVGLICLAGLAVACSDDDTSTSSSSSGNASSSSSGSSSSGSSSSGSSSSSSGSTSSSSSSGDAGDAGDAGSSGGTKEIGAACSSADATGDKECKSGHCFQQGGGGANPAIIVCSIACTKPTQGTDCVGSAKLTGQCTGKGFCQVEP